MKAWESRLRVYEPFIKVVRMLRALWYLRHCERVGSRTRCSGPIRVRNRGRMEIGRGVHIHAHRFPVELGTGGEGELVIGDGVYINNGVSIFAGKRIEIGEGTDIGPLTQILDCDFHGVSSARPIRIGRKVWIASQCVILKGVTIGDGAVVAAGSIVTHDVPAGAVIGGCTARVLRGPGAKERHATTGSHAAVN